MKEMLGAVAGDRRNASTRPMAIFDACRVSAAEVEQSHHADADGLRPVGIPAELISVPLLGATAPGLARRRPRPAHGREPRRRGHPPACRSGRPIIYGGSAAAVDMRNGTIAMGSVETMMLSARTRRSAGTSGCRLTGTSA